MSETFDDIFGRGECNDAKIMSSQATDYIRITQHGRQNLTGMRHRIFIDLATIIPADFSSIQDRYAHKGRRAQSLDMTDHARQFMFKPVTAQNRQKRMPLHLVMEFFFPGFDTVQLGTQRLKLTGKRIQQVLNFRRYGRAKTACNVNGIIFASVIICAVLLFLVVLAEEFPVFFPGRFTTNRCGSFRFIHFHIESTSLFRHKAHYVTLARIWLRIPFIQGKNRIVVNSPFPVLA